MLPFLWTKQETPGPDPRDGVSKERDTRTQSEGLGTKEVNDSWIVPHRFKIHEVNVVEKLVVSRHSNRTNCDQSVVPKLLKRFQYIQQTNAQWETLGNIIEMGHTWFKD